MVSLVVPLLITVFKVDLFKDWKNFILSTSIIAGVFLVWDAIFTSQGVWGFNHDYCLGLFIFKMPIEEWLFFFVIPFCSLFAHYAFFHNFPNIQLKNKTALLITIVLIILSAILIITNFSKAYTAVNFLFLLTTLLLGLFFKLELLQQFYISFLIILIPFFIVNGILTGTMIGTPIVWYNDLENLGVRLHTIPVEDIGYAFTMLFGNLMIFETLTNKKTLENVSLS